MDIITVLKNKHARLSYSFMRILRTKSFTCSVANERTLIKGMNFVAKR